MLNPLPLVAFSMVVSKKDLGPSQALPLFSIL